MPPKKQIVAVIAVERVIARTAHENVVAAAAVEGVVEIRALNAFHVLVGLVTQADAREVHERVGAAFGPA